MPVGPVRGSQDSKSLTSASCYKLVSPTGLPLNIIYQRPSLSLSAIQKLDNRFQITRKRMSYEQVTIESYEAYPPPGYTAPYPPPPPPPYEGYPPPPGYQSYFNDGPPPPPQYEKEQDDGCCSFLKGCLAALCCCCVLEECCCCI